MIDAECVHFLGAPEGAVHDLQQMVNGKNVKMPNKSGYRAGIPQKEPYTKWDTDKDEIEVDYKQMEDSTSPSWFAGAKGRLLKILIVLTVFLLGLIIGYVIRRSFFQDEMFTGAGCADGQKDYEDYSPDISHAISQSISAQNIDSYLRNYTLRVHLAGQHDNNLLKHQLQTQLEGFGLRVKTYVYKVLLSYADFEHPSFVSLLDENGTEINRTKYNGPLNQNTKFHREAQYPFNAFSPNGTVQGDIVYANHGLEGDFDELRRSNVSCKDKIIIMRYGRIYRGHKVENAAKCGAKAAILYSDPSEVTGQYTTKGDVYPHHWYLPDWAAQSGSILPVMEGDPLTPDLPSTEGVYRLPLDQAKLPTIPTLPISYGDAMWLMKQMKGKMGSNEFHGALSDPNVSYRLGPGYNEPRKNWKVSVTVNTASEQRPITNVVGVIEGETEPDRYVVVGCHYDAWGYGAVDPGGGTAIITEIAHAFSLMVKKGWRPRRTIMFVHWDAEEQGLMGSYEWVQEHQSELLERTVTYINLDGAVRGNHTLEVQANPMLRDILVNVTKMHQSALGGETVYNQWKRNSPDPFDASKTHIKNIGQGSDQAPFVFLMGIASIWPRYYFDIEKYGFVGYPAYHSMIDTYEYVKKFIDPDFKAHEVMAKLMAELILQFASRTKLPFNPQLLASTLEDECNKLTPCCGQDNKLESLQYAVGNFSLAATDFADQFDQLNLNDALAVRRYNDRLLRVSQAFLYYPGLPGRPNHRNILFAASSTNTYNGGVFAGIQDAYTLYSDPSTMPDDKQRQWQQVQRQISIAMLAVKSATRTLRNGLL